MDVCAAVIFRFNEERFLHRIFVLCLLSDMGHGKAKANGKAKHECHVCGKSGHHSTSCPQLAQDLLKALTKQCRAEDLSEHLRQQKHLRCVGVKSRPRRSLKKASGHRGSSFKTWKAASPTQKNKKQTRKRGSKKKHKEKDHLRKPRAMKDHAKQKKCYERDILQAYNHLKKQAWLWKPKTCACGGSWQRASYKESQCRGRGRLFWRCSDCRRFSDVMDHSLLPRVRMPLPHIDEAVTLYFQGSTAPTLETMASKLGHGGQSKSSLQKIRSALLTFEAEAAKKRQHKRKLRGIVEADATSLRKMKLPRTTTLRYFQAFGVASRESREVQLYDLGQMGLTFITVVISILDCRTHNQYQHVMFANITILDHRFHI